MGLFGKGTIVRDLTGIHFCTGVTLWKDSEYELLDYCVDNGSYAVQCVKDVNKKNLGMKLRLFINDFPGRFKIIKAGTKPFPVTKLFADIIPPSPEVQLQIHSRKPCKSLLPQTGKSVLKVHKKHT